MGPTSYANTNVNPLGLTHLAIEIDDLTEDGKPVGLPFIVIYRLMRVCWATTHSARTAFVSSSRDGIHLIHVCAHLQHTRLLHVVDLVLCYRYLSRWGPHHMQILT